MKLIAITYVAGRRTDHWSDCLPVIVGISTDIHAITINHNNFRRITFLDLICFDEFLSKSNFVPRRCLEGHLDSLPRWANSWDCSLRLYAIHLYLRMYTKKYFVPMLRRPHKKKHTSRIPFAIDNIMRSPAAIHLAHIYN